MTLSQGGGSAETFSPSMASGSRSLSEKGWARTALAAPAAATAEAADRFAEERIEKIGTVKKGFFGGI